MFRIFKVFYELILKCLTVKGIFFFTCLILAQADKIEGFYVFIAGSMWVGTREIYKHFIKERTNGPGKEGSTAP